MTEVVVVVKRIRNANLKIQPQNFLQKVSYLEYIIRKVFNLNLPKIEIIKNGEQNYERIQIFL